MSAIFDFIITYNTIVLDFMLENITFVISSLCFTFLVLMGGYINKLFYKQMKTFHLVLRVCLFILFAAFGFSVINIMMTNILKDGISAVMAINEQCGTIFVISLYILLGFMAERLKYGTRK